MGSVTTDFSGKVVIFSAPSGSGKTTIVRSLLARGLALSFSVSACTRLPRAGEQHGKDYYFMTPDEFRTHRDQGLFVEWEEVYPGTFYGTLRSEVERIWTMQRHVLFDVDVRGGLAIKKLYGSRALSVFVQPPSMEELGRRLRTRGTDSAEVVQQRLDKAAYELSFAPSFDMVIVNDHLEQASREAFEAVSRFIYGVGNILGAS